MGGQERNINRHERVSYTVEHEKVGNEVKKNGGQVEDDFGPSELIVETLYGGTGNRLGKIEEGAETTRDESVISRGYWKRFHYNTHI